MTEMATTHPMPTQAERLAVVEKDVKDIKDDVHAMNRKLDALTERLTSTRGAIAGAIAALTFLGGLGAFLWNSLGNFVTQFTHR